MMDLSTGIRLQHSEGGLLSKYVREHPPKYNQLTPAGASAAPLPAARRVGRGRPGPALGREDQRDCLAHLLASHSFPCVFHLRLREEVCRSARGDAGRPGLPWLGWASWHNPGLGGWDICPWFSKSRRSSVPAPPKPQGLGSRPASSAGRSAFLGAQRLCCPGPGAVGGNLWVSRPGMGSLRLVLVLFRPAPRLPSHP